MFYGAFIHTIQTIHRFAQQQYHACNYTEWALGKTRSLQMERGNRLVIVLSYADGWVTKHTIFSLSPALIEQALADAQTAQGWERHVLSLRGRRGMHVLREVRTPGGHKAVIEVLDTKRQQARIRYIDRPNCNRKWVHLRNLRPV